MSIADSIFNRLISRYTGGQGATTGYSTPQGGYPVPGTQTSYPTPGTAMPSWRTSAYGSAAAPAVEGPGLFGSAISGVGSLLTSGIGLLLNRGTPAAAAAGTPPTPAPVPTTAAAPTGVPSYGRFQSLIGSNQGIPAFARENMNEILKRNQI